MAEQGGIDWFAVGSGKARDAQDSPPQPEVDWFAIGAGRSREEVSLPREPEPLFPRPNERRLNELWENAVADLEEAATWGKVPERAAEKIYHPQLPVLRSRILRQWAFLGDDATIRSCVTLIGKMAEDPGATILGFTILTIALLEGGYHEQAEGVADLQAAYLKDIGFEPGGPLGAEAGPAAEPDGAPGAS